MDYSRNCTGVCSLRTTGKSRRRAYLKNMRRWACAMAMAALIRHKSTVISLSLF